MLVLTRKRDETVLLGEDIAVHVLKIKGDVVRLGFDAPRSLIIRRAELDRKETHDAKTTEGSQSPGDAD